MREIEIGKIYRHFKGNYYFIEDIAYDSETSKPVVIYKPIYDRDDEKKIWVRPLDMFVSTIAPNRPDNKFSQEFRFTLCEELSKNYLK